MYIIGQIHCNMYMYVPKQNPKPRSSKCSLPFPPLPSFLHVSDQINGAVQPFSVLNTAENNNK